MALWEMYFDESGDAAYDNLLAIGGYLIESTKARAMEEKWRAVLAAYDLSFFHMVDCAHGAGEFAKLTKAQRIDVQTQCIDLLVENVECGVGFLLNPSRRPESEAKDKAETAFQDGYTHALITTIMHLFWHAWNKDQNLDLALFIEAGHSSQSMSAFAIEHFLQFEKIMGYRPPVTYADKRQVCLLQTADIMAWQVSKMVKDVVLKSKRELRADMVSLKRAPHEFFYLSMDHGEMNVMRDAHPYPVIPPVLFDYIHGLFASGPDADEQVRSIRRLYDQLGTPHGAPGTAEGELAGAMITGLVKPV